MGDNAISWAVGVIVLLIVVIILLRVLGAV
jgi:hypothetical protein